jgi:glycosyltransferase involved in cell wall biosynthesis
MFDAIYSTSAPVTAHLVAGVVSRTTGKPWVAEFRDPWLGNPITAAVVGPRSWMHRRMQMKVERWIMHTADRIVFVSPSTRRIYRARYPRAAEMVCITNGHDPGDKVVGPGRRSTDKYRIVYAGTLRPDELDMFLAAVESLVLSQPASGTRLELVFYGDLSPACRAVADRYLGHGLLAGMLRFEGFVSRRAALEALASADAALLMLGGGIGLDQQIPAKLFDILGQSQQVLAVVPPGDARAILEELGWGVIASPSVADVERGLGALLATPRPGRVADPDGRYDRVALAARLAETLTAVSQGELPQPSDAFASTGAGEP